MKVALVYDRVNKFGGAERVLLALHEIYPDAPLYTAVYDPKGAPWASIFTRIITSFVQNLPLAKSHHEIYPHLMPLAFESFNFDEYDIVISVTSEAAKGIITKPKTLHICYCLTPTRYLWSGYYHYKNSPRYGILNPLIKPFIPIISARLRLWDKIASQRPDFFVAISKNVANRIKKYYQRDSTIIYPPVDTDKFQSQKDDNQEKYFLVVSRLVSYKRVDIVLEAFNKLGLPLKIIGDGAEMPYLKKIASSNIEFLGQNLTDEELISYYQNCQALIFAGEEDLGLVSLEAQSCGKPVICFQGGGIPETIQEGTTGEFFYPQNKEALINVIRQFNPGKYTPLKCRENAQKFDKKIFMTKFKQFMEEKWLKWQKGQI